MPCTAVHSDLAEPQGAEPTSAQAILGRGNRERDARLMQPLHQRVAHAGCGREDATRGARQRLRGHRDAPSRGGRRETGNRFGGAQRPRGALPYQNQIRSERAQAPVGVGRFVTFHGRAAIGTRARLRVRYV